MKKIDNFTNLYSVSKTLRFKAVPIGKTQENIEAKRLIEEDEIRAGQYKKAKKIYDRFHLFFIDKCLNDIHLSGLDEYVFLFNKSGKTAEDIEQMNKIEEKLRKQIANKFKSDDIYEKLFKDDMLKTVLPEFLDDPDEKKIIESFVGFKTAFQGFNKNRENLYSEEAKSTAISYRSINENLPRFITNMRNEGAIFSALGSEILNTINNELAIEPYMVENCFSIDFFDFVLTSAGIKIYNTFLGGYTKEDGTKIKGLNEYINLYNQQLSKTEKSKRLPKLLPLYKQILTEMVQPELTKLLVKINLGKL